jgi:hypothetical protein
MFNMHKKRSWLFFLGVLILVGVALEAYAGDPTGAET